MDLKQLIDLGRLSEALPHVVEELRSKPTDTRLRIAYFELLCLHGELDRASRQLDILAGQNEDLKANMLGQVFSGILKAEKIRRDFFAGSELPKFLSPPPVYVEKLVLLVQKMHDESDDVSALLEEAESACPELSGSVDDKEFSSIRDGDDRVAPVLEAYQGENYFWIPLEQVEAVKISEVKNLRDLMWIQSDIKIEAEKEPQPYFIPSLYVNSFQHADDAVKLGRTTDWQSYKDQLVFGLGHRQFLVDNEEIPLLNVGQIEIKK